MTKKKQRRRPEHSDSISDSQELVKKSNNYEFWQAAMQEQQKMKGKDQKTNLQMSKSQGTLVPATHQP